MKKKSKLTIDKLSENLKELSDGAIVGESIMKKKNIYKWTVVTPSPFDDDFYISRKAKRLVTFHQLQPTFDKKGYVITYGRIIKRVSRDIKTNKILSIKP